MDEDIWNVKNSQEISILEIWYKELFLNQQESYFNPKKKIGKDVNRQCT